MSYDAGAEIKSAKAAAIAIAKRTSTTQSSSTVLSVSPATAASKPVLPTAVSVLRHHSCSHAVRVAY